MVFSECEYVDASDPLRQGDVLRSLNPSNDPWEEYAIVVTADCDIARDKHGGRLTCVPVLPLHFYLASYYLPRRIAKSADAIDERLVGIMRRAQRENFAEYGIAISRERADAWLLETSPLQVAEALQIRDEDRETFLELAQQMVLIKGLVPGNFDDYCEAFITSQLILKPSSSRSAVKESLSNDLVAHTRELPGDALYLSSMGADLDSGYVAYLRVLREVREGCVALKSSQLGFDITHERITRVQALYVHALTQRLGAVFSAIGLPSEYEAARTQRSRRLLETVQGE